VTFLLDVNVLIALVDASHVSHDAAHDWFAREGHVRWATCPITENGLVRIVSNPKYPNNLATPAEAMALLVQLASLPGHVFWPDDISVRDAALFTPAKMLTTLVALGWLAPLFPRILLGLGGQAWTAARQMLGL